jgi:hypothetical protein
VAAFGELNKFKMAVVAMVTKVQKIKIYLNPLFFVSMATAAKFVQPIPICLAYLVPLDVDVVPIKFHQFLLGE